MSLSQIEDVRFREDALQRGVIPCLFAELRFDAVRLQALCDLGDGVPADELPVYPPDDLRLFLDDLIHIVAIFVLLAGLPVSEHQAGVQDDVAVLELPLPCPLDVAADRPAFLFGHGREYGQEHFASGRQRIDVFALEVHADVHQPFCPGNAKIGLRNSRAAAPKPDFASDLPVFA